MSRFCVYSLLACLFVLGGSLFGHAQIRSGEVRPFLDGKASKWGCIVSESGTNSALRLFDPISVATDVSSVSIRFETTSARRFRQLRRSSSRKRKQIGRAGLVCLRERARFSNPFEKAVGDGSGAGGSGGSGGGGAPLMDDPCTAVANGRFTRSSSEDASVRIINGSKCKIGDSPVVELAISSSRGFSTCTGVVVGENKILSAAHCVTDQVGCSTIATNIAVRAGDNSAVVDDDAEFVVHPDYRCVPFIPGAGQFDVIVLTTDAVIPTRRFGVLSDRTALKADTPLLIAGYGLIDSNGDGVADGANGDGLHAGFMSLVSASTAEILSTFDFTSNPDSSNTCSGDSGGPALVKVNNEYLVAGLTSYGTIQECGPLDETVGFVNLTDPVVQSFLEAQGVS